MTKKTTSDPATLAVGEQICVVHDPAVMMSLPPQSVAYTVIRNFPAGTDLEQEARDAACPVKKVLRRHPQGHFGLVLPDHAHLRGMLLL